MKMVLLCHIFLVLTFFNWSMVVKHILATNLELITGSPHFYSQSLLSVLSTKQLNTLLNIFSESWTYVKYH